MSPAQSKRMERALAILDAGAQSSPEPGYGTDVGPGFCARCQGHDPASDGDLCGGCRAFLLGDTDEDPCTAVVTVDPADLVALHAWFREWGGWGAWRRS